MHNFAQEFIKKIEENQTIVLFRHQHPDNDAFGSQLGLLEWLKAAYPDKTILAAGFEGGQSDSIDDQMIESALAIVTDTSNKERVDDSRFKIAKDLIRLDHHVRVETFDGLELVDDQAAATCELIPLILKDAGISIPEKAAQHLLEGLMSDTQQFAISTVRPATFEAGGWLIEQGADPVRARKLLFSVPYEGFVYGARVKAKAVRKGRFLYSMMMREDYLPLGLSASKARDHVNDLADIEGIEVWALFTETQDGGKFNVSLRSSTISIRDLAAALGGGGHECACGIKNLTSEQILQLIEDCTKRAESRI